MSDTATKQLCGAYRLNGSSPRGFAAIKDPKERSRIAGIAGRRAQELGRAYRWTSETAREAGRLGGSRTK